MQTFALRLAATILLAAGAVSCTPAEKHAAPAPPAPAAAYPRTTFAVFSDPHLYDTRLGTTGAAFQRYLDGDRKLLVESGELFDAVVDAILAAPSEFVLVCGDLTKDGEASGHRAAAEKLRRLTDAGKAVLVVPGNHDVRNGAAVRYAGNETAPVPSITPAEFADIYHDFGYGRALERDAASLSYVAEPVAGLRVLALDTCRYRENRPGREPITGGAVSEATLAWMDGALLRARAAGAAVIAFQHHGVMEHYPKNEKYYGRYLVAGHAALAERLSRGGVSMVFTGHFHAQDITRKTFPDGRVLYDIETGATVTAPCPYRLVSLGGDGRADIRSRFIRRIPSRADDFPAYAEGYVFDGTLKLADAALKKYGVSEADRRWYNPQIAAAYVAHLNGDEKVPAAAVDHSGAGFWGRLIASVQADLLRGWYTDLPPADNDVVLDLAAPSR